MSLEEEKSFLEMYKAQAAQGQLVEVGTIKKAYEEKVGHSIGGSQIYYVLHRHKWRKIMPRSKHPNKASDEAIEASKKLKTQSQRPLAI
jgi:transposase